MGNAGAFVHGVHVPAPAALYVPIAHGIHARPFPYVPAGHILQPIWEVGMHGDDMYQPGPQPGAQLAQTVTPVPLEYVFAGQVWLSTPLQNVPGGHRLHTILEVTVHAVEM